MLEENNRILQSFRHKLMYQGTMFTQTVRVIALGNNYNFRMLFQAGNHFIRLCHIGHKQEFKFCIAAAH